MEASKLQGWIPSGSKRPNNKGFDEDSLRICRVSKEVFTGPKRSNNKVLMLRIVVI